MTRAVKISVSMPSNLLTEALVIHKRLKPDEKNCASKAIQAALTHYVMDNITMDDLDRAEAKEDEAHRRRG